MYNIIKEQVMNIQTRAYRHLKTITKHKFLVMKYCFKCGIIWRGLMHDNSKYSPIELFNNIKYYDGNRSPIVSAKEKIGYSIAWQHHKGHNPHHWEYWIDNVGTRKNTPVPMPKKFIIEMVCDWIAAGQTYLGENWDSDKPIEYYNKSKSEMILHPDTAKLVEKLVKTISINGLKEFYKLAKEILR